MKTVLLHPMYFGSIAQYAAMAKNDVVIFEDHDNYQKQTYRNRTYIYGANGKLLLTIPIKHTSKHSNGKQLYKDVRIENEFQWQSLHWKSIQTAYRTSPFFEYYEDELVPLFEKKKDYLLDFNYECMEAVNNCLQLEISYSKTQTFLKEYNDLNDQRNLVNAKKGKHHTFSSYIQVFSEKHGFISNLSILDLLFNEGTNAITYLDNLIIY